MIVSSQRDVFVHDSNSISVEEKSQMQHLSVSLIFIIKQQPYRTQQQNGKKRRFSIDWLISSSGYLKLERHGLL